MAAAVENEYAEGVQKRTIIIIRITPVNDSLRYFVSVMPSAERKNTTFHP